jgi:hypothetical protein
MKIQSCCKILLAVAAISLSSLCIINSAQAQSAAARAASRSAASQSPAEQVRRDANSIKCRHQGVGRYAKWPDGRWHSLPQTACSH